MKCLVPVIAPYVLLSFAAALPATATVIDFEAQAANRGGNLTGIPDSPLLIGTTTFTGGELRQAEIGLFADQTGVSASEGLFGSGETNPLVIAFASPVNDFSVFVVNVDNAENYTVSDNLGDSVTISLASVDVSGAATFSLAGNGVTTVTGFLCGDAETRTIKNDVSLTVFSVATKNSWKDAESGEWAFRTEWHRCVAFGRLADTSAALKKGDHIHVRSQLQTREYTGAKTPDNHRITDPSFVHVYLVSDVNQSP